MSSEAFIPYPPNNKLELRLAHTLGPANVFILNGHEINKVRYVKVDAGYDRVTEVTFTVIVDELVTLPPTE